MKRLLSVFCIIVLMIFACGCEKTSVNTSADVTLRFVYGDEDIRVTLEDDEAKRVIDILDENDYYPAGTGILSCGFDKNISLKVGGRTFAIACDTCNCILDLGNLKCFDIPQEDIDYIHSLFEKYGGYFPCI